MTRADRAGPGRAGENSQIGPARPVASMVFYIQNAIGEIGQFDPRVTVLRVVTQVFEFILIV